MKQGRPSFWKSWMESAVLRAESGNHTLPACDRTEAVEDASAGSAGRIFSCSAMTGVEVEGGGMGGPGQDALERGGGVPPPLQGAQPMPGHCLPGSKCQPPWHL